MVAAARIARESIIAMALEHFTELVAAISDWINRDDLVTRVPTFIALCESKLNRSLRVRQMEASTALILPAGELGSSLPDDLLELRTVRLVEPLGRPLRLISPEQPSGLGGEPRGFVLFGSRLKLLPSPQQSTELSLSYYAQIPPLESAGENWLLKRHPDLYLYGALLEAEAFVVNPEKISLWRSLFNEVLDAVSGEDRHVRWSGSSLAPSPISALR